MATVRAPYPSETTEIAESSIYAVERTETNIVFTNRGGAVVADLQVANPDEAVVPAIVRPGSFDAPYRDVLVKDWYRKGSPNVRLAAPATPPPEPSVCLAWSPDETYLAVGNESYPTFSVYKRAGDVFTKLANPSYVPVGTVEALAWSPSGQHLAVAGIGPYLDVYKRSGDTLTNLSAIPTPWPTNTLFDVAWSPDGQYLVATCPGADPYLFIYKRSGDTFALLPSISPTLSGAYKVAWSPDGKYLAVGRVGTTPHLTIYQQSGDTFTKLPGPTDLPTTNVVSMAWSPEGEYLACGVAAGATGATVVIYKRSGSQFTRLANLPDLPTGATSFSATDVAWSPDGQYFGVTTLYSLYAPGYLMIYQRTEDVFRRLSNSSLQTPPNADAYSVGWSPSGTYMACGYVSSPWFGIWKSAKGPQPGAAARVTPLP